MCSLKEAKEEEDQVISERSPVLWKLMPNLVDLNENLLCIFTVVFDYRRMTGTAGASSGPGDRERTRDSGTDISSVVQLRNTSG